MPLTSCNGKPGNVLLDTKGNVKLCDFGLASLSSDRSLQTTMVGTTFYMAPERLRAQQYGRSSDLWSFGLVILEASIRKRKTFGLCTLSSWCFVFVYQPVDVVVKVHDR